MDPGKFKHGWDINSDKLYSIPSSEIETPLLNKMQCYGNIKYILKTCDLEHYKYSNNTDNYRVIEEGNGTCSHCYNSKVNEWKASKKLSLYFMQ